MYLASGVARVVEMRQKGITVALASDGAGSNNRQDMFEVLKAAVLLQKVHRLDAMALQPEDALEMACVNGAHVVGTPGDFGRIQPGAAADLLVVSLKSPFVAPVHRIPSALVFNASPADIVHVFVAGEHLIDHGRHRSVDTDEVVAAAEQAARRLFQRAGIPTRLG
jgi:5-methylthioadenosine/S-adenosylhomocysteine deaminase